jgi:hypothetical protein
MIWKAEILICCKELLYKVWRNNQVLHHQKKKSILADQGHKNIQVNKIHFTTSINTRGHNNIPVFPQHKLCMTNWQDLCQNSSLFISAPLLIRQTYEAEFVQKQLRDNNQKKKKN